MVPTSPGASPDVVVVGAGIVGSAVTLFLARAGLKVLLLDRGGIAGGTSSCCMGHLMVTADPAYSHALTRHSVALWNQLFETVPGIERRMTGAFYLAEDEDDLPLLHKLQHDFAGHGEVTEILDGRELREREPGLAKDLPGALFYPKDGIVMPMQAISRMLWAAREAGAEIRPFCPVTGLELGANRRIEGVSTADGVIKTSRVVNATGVLASTLTVAAGLGPAPIHPRRGDLAITNARTAPIRTQLLEVSYLRVAHGAAADPTRTTEDRGAQAMNVQPQTNGTCLIGSTRQFAGMDRRVNLELLQHSLRRAARYVPDLASAQITRTWAGLRPYSEDKMPIVGAVEDVPGFYMAAGHEGLGITLAPVTGELIMQAVTGQPGSLPIDRLSWARFGARPEKKHPSKDQPG